MEIILRKGANKLDFVADNSHTTIALSGSPKDEQTEKTFSPMEMLLSSLGGCMAIDIMNILEKQRQVVDELVMQLKGDRKEAVPRAFKHIQFTISLKGEIDPAKLEKAIQLSEDKYCSVLHSLSKDIEMDIQYQIN